jgi:hypothetical protein
VGGPPDRLKIALLQTDPRRFESFGSMFEKESENTPGQLYTTQPLEPHKDSLVKVLHCGHSPLSARIVFLAVLSRRAKCAPKISYPE